MIDLHCHSTASDGSCTPTELVEMACRLRLAALALTDHDTIGGLSEFRAAAAGRGLEAVCGIELASRDERLPGIGFHIVGLFMRGEAPQLLALLEDVVRWRQERNRQILARLQERGLAVTLEEAEGYAAGGILGRPHIAQTLVAHGYAHDIQNAFERYLATGKPGYVSRQVPTPAEAVAAIHADGGVAIWAHPFTRGNYTVAQTRRIAVELKDVGLDGIEAYYPLHTPTQTRNVLKIAAEVGLLVSGGSDFHGMRFRNVELGTGYGKLRVPDELLAPLRAARR